MHVPAYAHLAVTTDTGMDALFCIETRTHAFRDVWMSVLTRLNHVEIREEFEFRFFDKGVVPLWQTSDDMSINKVT